MEEREWLGPSTLMEEREWLGPSTLMEEREWLGSSTLMDEREWLGPSTLMEEREWLGPSTLMEEREWLGPSTLMEEREWPGLCTLQRMKVVRDSEQSMEYLCTYCKIHTGSKVYYFVPLSHCRRTARDGGGLEGQYPCFLSPICLLLEMLLRRW